MRFGWNLQESGLLQLARVSRRRPSPLVKRGVQLQPRIRARVGGLSAREAVDAAEQKA